MSLYIKKEGKKEGEKEGREERRRKGGRKKKERDKRHHASKKEGNQQLYPAITFMSHLNDQHSTITLRVQ